MNENRKLKEEFSWDNFLDPKKMRDALSKVSFYLLCYELLKSSIIDRIKSFYSFRYENGNPIPDAKYHADVEKRNKSILYASISWLDEMGVISPEDKRDFEEIKALRNIIAHESKEIINGRLIVTESDFEKIQKLLKKIEIWWIQYIDIPTNPDYDGKEIQDSEILPGPSLILQLIQSIAFENESKDIAS